MNIIAVLPTGQVNLTGKRFQTTYWNLFHLINSAMEQYKAKKYPYKIISANKDPDNPPYPLLKSESGDDKMFGISREHGRSYIVGKNNGRHIISKGNGLSYSQYRFLNFGEFAISESSLTR